MKRDNAATAGFLILGALGACAPAQHHATPAVRAGWIALAPLPAPRFLGPQVAFAEGRLVALGGLVKEGERYYPTDRVDLFDPRRRTWTQGAPMPAAASDFAVATLGTHIFVSGGSGRAQGLLEEYDVAANRWTSRSPNSVPRVHHAAVAVDGAIYVIGGRGTPERLERYDPVGDHWTRLPDLPHPKENPYAVAAGGRIYVLGGMDSAGEAEYARFEVFDPRTGEWRELAPLPTRRTDIAMVAMRGRIYVLGGWTMGGLSAAVDVYDPARERWSSAPALPRVLSFAGAAASGRTIYLVGGAQYVAERLTPFGSLLALEEE